MEKLMELIKWSKVSPATVPDSLARYSVQVFVDMVKQMDREEFSHFMRYLLALEHHKDTTVGCFATDQDPRGFLHAFWQRTSDACPLECTEAEEQEKWFEGFVNDRIWEIKFTGPVDVQDPPETQARQD